MARPIIHEGISEIITPDRGFDQVAEVRRIDPMSFADLPA
jgi:predicted nucleic acid-binding protein